MSARTATLLGWAVLVAAFVVLEGRALARRGRFATIGDALDRVLATRAGRGFLVLGWLWAGWHLFVR